MSKSKKRALGDLGEDISCIYLKKKGYLVLARNYWKPWGEIDVVCKKDGQLVFVEVKTVSHEMGESGRVAIPIRPEENMHPAKVQKLSRAISSYLAEEKTLEDVAWRIDLTCVYLDVVARRAKVELFENITM